MANKVLFEIEVDANFRDLIKLQTEMDKLQKEQKDAAKAGQKNTNIYQQNRQELKRLKDEYKHTEKQLKSNKTSTKALGTSYNDLTNHNKRLSAELRKIQNPLTKDKQLFDKLSASMHKNEQTLKKMDAAMGRNQRNVGNYGSALGGLGKSFLSSAAGALGLVGGVQLAFNAIGGAVNTIKEFEQAGANLKAVLGDLATEDNITKLSEDAKRLGASTAFSATEVRSLQTEFAKLGFDPTAIVNATEATLDLAAATGTDLATAASVAGGTLGAFELGASQTQRVTDVMAKSFSISALDMEKFSESMKNAAPAAHAVGLSVEETTALLGTLSKANITGSKAGSNLATGFINLKAKGIDLNDALEKIKGSAEPLSEAVNLVGKNAAKSFLVLANGQKTTEGYIQSLNDAEGAAHDMAMTQLDTLDGALKILSSSYEGLILSMEDGNGVMSNIAKIIVQDVSTALSLLSGNVSAADEQFSYLGIVISQIKVQFKLVTGVIKLMSLPLQLLWKVAVKVAEKFGLVSDSASGVKETLLSVQQVVTRLPAIIDIVVEEISQSFLRIADIFTQLGRGFRALFSGDFATVKQAGKSLANIFADGFNDIATDIPKRIKDLWKKQNIQGSLDEAEVVGEELAKSVKTGMGKELSKDSFSDFIQKSIDEDEKLNKLKVTLKIEPDVEADTNYIKYFHEHEQIIRDEQLKRDKELAEKRKELNKQIANETFKLAQQTSDAIFSIMKANVDRQKDYKQKQLEIEDTFERELLKSRLESGSISQEEYENNLVAQKEKTDARNEQIEREAFERNKRLSTAQALINGALAVITTFAQLGWPAGIVGAAAVAASTAVEVGVIQAQQFADGGLLQGASHDQGGIPMTVNGKAGYEAEGGEFIINREATAQNYQLLKSINESTLRKPTYSGYNRQFANGGLVSQGGISQVDLSRQAEVLAQQINQIKVVNVATETAAVNDNAIKIENEFTL